MMMMVESFAGKTSDEAIYVMYEKTEVKEKRRCVCACVCVCALFLGV